MGRWNRQTGGKRLRKEKRKQKDTPLSPELISISKKRTFEQKLPPGVCLSLCLHLCASSACFPPSPHPPLPLPPPPPLSVQEGAPQTLEKRKSSPFSPPPPSKPVSASERNKPFRKPQISTRDPPRRLSSCFPLRSFSRRHAAVLKERGRDLNRETGASRDCFSHQRCNPLREEKRQDNKITKRKNEKNSRCGLFSSSSCVSLSANREKDRERDREFEIERGARIGERERQRRKRERKLSHLWSSSFDFTFLSFLFLSLLLLSSSSSSFFFLSSTSSLDGNSRGVARKGEISPFLLGTEVSPLSGDSRPFSRCPGEKERKRNSSPFFRSGREVSKKRICPARAPALEKGCKFLPARALAAAQRRATRQSIRACPPASPVPGVFRAWEGEGEERESRDGEGGVRGESVRRENRKRKERGAAFFLFVCLFFCKTLLREELEQQQSHLLYLVSSSAFQAAILARRSSLDSRPPPPPPPPPPRSSLPRPRSLERERLRERLPPPPPLLRSRSRSLLPPSSSKRSLLSKSSSPVAVFAPVPPPSLSSPVVVAVAVAAPRRRGPPVPVPVPVPVCPPPEQLAAQGARDRPQVHKVAVAVVVFWGEGGGGGGGAGGRRGERRKGGRKSVGLGDRERNKRNASSLRSKEKNKRNASSLRSKEKTKRNASLRCRSARRKAKKNPKKTTPYPPRAQHLSSYCLHVASLKSVTGENSATIGLPS